MRFSRFLSVSFLLAAGWAASCASDADRKSANPSSSPPTSVGGRGQALDNLSLGGNNAGAPTNFNPLCGNPVACNPDAATACAPPLIPPPGTGGAPSPSGGAPAVGGGPGMGSEAGAGGGASAGQAGEAAGVAGMSGAGQAGSVSNAGSLLSGGVSGVVPPVFEAPPALVEYACRVQRSPEAAAIAACAPAGKGATDDPCTTSKDCKGGLACVGDAALARCRPFCCGGDEACATGTYCAEQPLREEGGATAPGLRVPVCVTADKCDLGEPFPCPNASLCTCSTGTACSVVRSDGTTSCVIPGRGLAGDTCPCAAGHICSKGSQRCLALCRTTDLNGACDPGRCQTAAGLPTNYGVCVGAPSVPNAGAGGDVGTPSP